jgi:AcrR family transcriptional regulator
MMKKETPRQRRKAKNRTIILDAATHLIVTKGFENVSLRDIAKNADYSPAALYKYFRSKVEIMQAVSNRENQKLLDLLGTVGLNLSPQERLVKLCLLYIQFSLENQAFLALVNNLPSGRRSKQQPVSPGSPYLVFYQAVQTWVHDENITLPPNYDIEDVTYALWTQIHGMATLRSSQLKDFEADFEATNRRTIEIFLNGLQKWEQ